MAEKIKVNPIIQNIVNLGLLLIISVALWYIFKPVEFINQQTIINNKEFIVIGFVILTFFEFEFWAGIKRIVGKEPGKFVPGILSTLIFMFFVVPQLGIGEFLLKGGLIALILWWAFLFIGALFVVNRTHWLTLVLFIILTIAEFFDPTQALLGGILGVVLFAAFVGIEIFINKRSYITAIGIAIVLSWALILPSIIMNIALIIVMLIHKKFTPIHFGEVKK